MFDLSLLYSIVLIVLTLLIGVIIYNKYSTKTNKHKTHSNSNFQVITTYNETYDFSNVVLRMYNNFGMNNTTIDFSNMIILEGDWSENLSDIINNLNKYKANIRIKNPNAPIFGKGGRL